MSAGPFTSSAAQPLICPVSAGGAIDPASFVDSNGTRYVMFKNNGNAVGVADVLQVCLTCWSLCRSGRLRCLQAYERRGIKNRACRYSSPRIG